MCFNLKEITIPGNVKSIEDDAFVGCESLKSISIPSSVTYIGYCAFSYSGLTDVYYDGTKEQWNAIEIVNNANEATTIYVTAKKIREQEEAEENAKAAKSEPDQA